MKIVGIDYISFWCGICGKEFCTDGWAKKHLMIKHAYNWLWELFASSPHPKKEEGG